MEKGFNVDELLDSLFTEDSLSDLFEKRIKELDMLPTNALEIMNIEYRALQGILNGTSTRADARNFVKLSNFLNIPKVEVIRLFYKALENNFSELKGYSNEKIDFINENFDLATLKRIGFIDDISDYEHIEERINHYFGYKSIFEYKLPSQEIAFSAGLREAKSPLSKGMWLRSAIDTFNEINNPNVYDREKLIEYFPSIRWQSINVEKGLINVVKDLYMLGVTVLYQSNVPSLNLKGATILVNNKPCIVLTNYRGYYTTLWHTLCHELSHVLFDLEDIKKGRYHISEDDDNAELPVIEKEKAADYFAKEYLFSEEKLKSIKAHISNQKVIKEFASKHQVHETFIYTYYAFEYCKEDLKAWSRVKSKDPNIKEALNLIENKWDKDVLSIKEHINILKTRGIYGN